MEVALRNWEESDLEDLVRLANNEKISNNLADAFPHPFTKEDGMDFIKKSKSHNPTQLFAITYKGQIAGSIGIFPDTDVHRKNAAIGYWIGETFWGKGISTRAIQIIVDYGFSTFDIQRIYAKPYGDNAASHRVLEKVGFTLEATLPKVIFKQGKFMDERIYGIRK